MTLLSKAYIALFFLLPMCTFGQTGSDFEYGIGFRLGYSDFTSNSGDFGENTVLVDDDATLVPAVNVHAAYKWTSKLKLASGLGISWKGAEDNDGNSQIMGIYLEMPWRLQYRIWDQLWISGGPKYGYLLHLNQSVNDTDVDITDLAENRHHLSLDLSVGYTIADLVELSLFYERGLTDVLRYTVTDGNGSEIGDLGIKNRQFGLAILVRR